MGRREERGKGIQREMGGGEKEKKERDSIAEQRGRETREERWGDGNIDIIHISRNPT